MPRTLFDVCAVDELEPGTMRPVEVGGRELVLVRSLDGGFTALQNSCSHMGARLSDGRLQRKMEGPRQNGYAVSADAEVLRCPWHGYEFDIRSGVCAGDPERVRVRAYPVSTRDGRVLVER